MNVLIIPAGNASEWTGPTGNNTYLLTGTIPTLIDAGLGLRSHLDSVAEGLQGATLALVLITHNHPDHIGGIPAIHERWPSAVVRNVPPNFCRDGEIIQAGDVTLRAVHTPGHSPDHFSFVDESTLDVYCGDLARMGGTIVIPASTGGSLSEYLDSLQRIRALAPRRLLPGHGPVVMDPIGLIDDYMAHRRQRERQIVDALQNGSTSIDDIVRRVYGELPPTLVAAARDSVHAHLIKLDADRRAVEMSDGWTLVGEGE